MPDTPLARHAIARWIAAIALVAMPIWTALALAQESPIPNPETLVGVGPAFPQLGRALSFDEALSAPEIGDIRNGSGTLDRLVAFDLGRRRVAAGKEKERLFTAFWWGEPLETLGIAPLLGRTFTPEELAGRAGVAVLSHRAWQRLYGGDPGAVGSALEIEMPQRDGSSKTEEHTVIGVLPDGVTVYGTDLWLPMWAPESVLPRDRRQFQVLARIGPGQTLETVNAELLELAHRVEHDRVEQAPEYAGWTLEAATWQEVQRRRRGR